MEKKRRRVKRCHWCERELTKRGGQMATRDHVRPRSKGGRYTVPCCLACNNLKGDMMPSEWFDYMRANPQWWRLARV